eukprot:TRINITY_DN10804_c0_g2_i1.p1 TRINITY_DN10804_c0_g2~~TRINITY_DN10804_c0_g2_i1.p1  ORF type:complete len:132 (+),score=18.82 TRINITY_DN10804_c0_g2_i1:1194-1589(+)
MRDNIFKLIKGKLVRSVDSNDYVMVLKNRNVYEINKKLPWNSTGVSLSMFEVQERNRQKYAKVNMKTISNCLQAKSFFNPEKRVIKQREARNMFERKSERAKIVVGESNNTRLEDIKRIKVQGLFVNKLYE